LTISNLPFILQLEVVKLGLKSAPQRKTKPQEEHQYVEILGQGTWYLNAIAQPKKFRQGHLQASFINQMVLKILSAIVADFDS
jgi:hypothetical protein